MRTAVEWLYNQLSINNIALNQGTKAHQKMEQKFFEQAKEMEKKEMIALGKRCFYKGFEKAESDDANCFTAWREEAEELLTIKSE